jgi:hypothetical protein
VNDKCTFHSFSTMNCLDTFAMHQRETVRSTSNWRFIRATFHEPRDARSVPDFYR